ncbi:MAG: hypothetical protein ACLS9A_09240 [Clostridia bacterium]
MQIKSAKANVFVNRAMSHDVNDVYNELTMILIVWTGGQSR